MPTKVLGELLGRSPGLTQHPVTIGSTEPCPFRTALHAQHHDSAAKKTWTSNCVKKSSVCSVYAGATGPAKSGLRQTSGLVCTCPSRFYEPHIIDEIAQHAWGKPPGTRFSVATEVSLGGKWYVDMALFTRDGSGNVRDFCSVEVQAIDITNSVKKHVDAFVAQGRVAPAIKDPGLNWANATIKRLFTQLLFKGYMHHVWGKKMAVVIQDKTLEYIEDTVTLATVPAMEKADICILPYRYREDSANSAAYTLELVENSVRRVPYGSFALSTLSIQLPDIDQHMQGFVRQMI